jgi:hypothetical protein
MTFSDSPAADSNSAPPATVVTGTLHVFVAFDWGDEVNLDAAKRLVRGEFTLLRRRRRTPSSIAYRPSPLRLSLEPLPLMLPEVGPLNAPAKVTVFDFAAVSLAVQVPFSLPLPAMTRLAGYLADPTSVVQAARLALQPLFDRMLPAIKEPLWGEMGEEYFVFQLPPGGERLGPEFLCGPLAAWAAGLVLLEAGPLSTAQVNDALRLHLGYSPDDLFVPNWAAAILLDRDCDETLQIIEFANLQLLEFRHIDDRLDATVAAAYRLIHPLTRTWLPFWRTPSRPMRALGELKVEANDLFERTGNVLKLVGDQYLARIYRLLADRFHLKEWEQSIQRKLDVIEGVYQVLSDQATAYRLEVLELVVILLIFIEVVMSLLRH